VFPAFAIACGEEASDPLVLHEGRTVRVDELAASGHLARQDEDLGAVAGLGVRVWRYGMPWRLSERAPGAYDWTLWDRALDACARHGLEPVVDWCHFGLPDHYAGFCAPDWVEGFCRYVEAFLARYPGPRWFTPVNEPGITALFSARYGIWNDRRRGEADYARALAHVTLANLEALARVRADRGGEWIGSEGFACHVAASPEHEPAAASARALGQAVWDLHFGLPLQAPAVGLYDAVPDTTLARIAALAAPRDGVVAGHDFYPVSVVLHGPARELSIQDRVDAYLHEARLWHARYGRDFWVAETSNLGLPVSEQVAWLEALSAGLGGLRAEGLPVRGLCWYSRGDQYDWDTALTRPVGKLTEVGLFDADRRPRPAAEACARLARGGLA
jgi:hypothetical protein